MIKIYRRFVDQKHINQSKSCIEKYLQSTNEDALQVLVSRLQRIPTRPRNKALFDYLRSADDYTHNRIIEVIGTLKKSTIPYVQNILKKSSTEELPVNWSTPLIRSSFGACASCLGRLQIQDAIPDIFKGITSRQLETSTKIVGVKAIGEMKNEASLAQLHDLLAHKNLAILRETSKIIGQFGKRVSLAPLIIHLRHDDEVRAIATYAISLMDPDLVVPIVSQILRYSTLNQIPGSVTQLPAYPLDEDSRILSACILGEFQMQANASSNLVLAYHQNDTIQVKCAILAAMGVSKDPTVLNILLAIAQTELDDLQLAAIAAIGVLGLKKALEPLRDLLAQQQNYPETQVQICRAYSAIGSKAALPFIRECLIPTQYKLCITALECIQEVGSITNEEIVRLASLCTTSNWHIRYNAQRTLIKLATSSHISTLHLLLKHSNIHLKTSIFQALGLIGGIESILDLIEAILFDGLSSRSAARAFFDIAKRLNNSEFNQLKSYINSHSNPNRYHPEILAYFYKNSPESSMPLLHFISILHCYESESEFVENCFSRVQHCETTYSKLRLLTPSGVQYLIDNHFSWFQMKIIDNIDEFESSHRAIEIGFASFLNQPTKIPTVLEVMQCFALSSSIESIYEKIIYEHYQKSLIELLQENFWSKLMLHHSFQEILDTYQQSSLFDSIIYNHSQFLYDQISQNIDHIDFSTIHHPALIFNWYTQESPGIVNKQDLNLLFSHINQLHLWYPSNSNELAIIASHFFDEFFNSNSTKEVDDFIQEKPKDLTTLIQKLPNFFHYLYNHTKLKNTHKKIFRSLYLSDLNQFQILLGNIALKSRIWTIGDNPFTHVTNTAVLESNLANRNTQIHQYLKEILVHYKNSSVN